MKKRILAVDIARALCIIYIVGCWHMSDYTVYGKELFGVYGPFLTRSALACFTFLSGFFLGKKDCTPLSFYISRFKRFYPLFFIACLTAFIGGWFTDVRQFLFTITGLSNFILPQPKTFWYMSMLLAFYMLTPVVLWKKKSGWDIMIGVLLWILICGVYMILHVDTSFSFYFPFYLLGIFTPFSLIEIMLSRFKWPIFAISFIFCAIMLSAISCIGCPSSIKWVMALLGALSIIALSGIISSVSKFKKVNSFFSFVAYSSLCFYLFHRHVYLISHLLNDEYGNVGLVGATVMFLSALLIAYFIQSGYDKYFDRIWLRLSCLLNKVSK